MTEQHAEQACAEEAGEQAAEEARPIEEAAHRRGHRGPLRERTARLAGLRHAAFDGARGRRRRGRRRRGERLRAAAAEAPPAPRAGIGIACRERQHRKQGAKRKQRTGVKTKHDVLPVGSTHNIGIPGRHWKRCRTVSQRADFLEV